MRAVGKYILQSKLNTLDRSPNLHLLKENPEGFSAISLARRIKTKSGLDV